MRDDEQESDMRRSEPGEIAKEIEAPAFMAALRKSGVRASKERVLIPGDPLVCPKFGQGSLQGLLQGLRKSAEAIVPEVFSGRAELKEKDLR